MMTGMNASGNLDPNNTDIRKTAVIDSELSKRQISIAALQETRLAGAGTIKESEYTFFWFGKAPEEPRIYGTGFAVLNCLTPSILTPYAVSDRISVLKMKTNQGDILIINAYAPTLAASADDKDRFYCQLEDAIKLLSSSERTILLGDMNARVGADHISWLQCLGKFGVGKINENGQRLLELCSRNNMCITNTMFPGKPHRKMSWCHPRSKTWHQLDFVIISQKHKQEVLNTRTYHSADCDTDHSLVVSSLRLQPRPYHRQRLKSKKIDVCKINVPELKQQYCSSLAEKLQDAEWCDDPDSLWTGLKNVIHQTALDVFGLKQRQDPDWYRDSRHTLEPVLEQKRKALLRLKSRPTRCALAEHRAAKAHAQQTVRECVRAYWDSLCTRIETARASGNIKEMFEAIKTATGPSIQTAGVLKKKDGTVIEDQDQKLNRWIEHYSELYGTEGTADHAYITNLPATATDHSLDEHPDSDEIIQIIQSLRSGKAAGEDEIPAELLKAGIEPLAESILHLISACWSSKSVPQDFKNAKITTLYKNKGERGDCNNYRGISLLCVTGKVLARILLRRLQQLAERVYPEAQCGFRAKRSTTDMIFAVRQLQEKSREQRQPLYLAFVDLTKAFDLVDRTSLFTVLAKAGCPPTLLALIQSFHEGMLARVQYDGAISDSFPINKGVKQGCVLAPTLFGLYFSYVFRVTNSNLVSSTGVSILSRDDGNFFNLSRFKAKSRTQRVIVSELLYADDAALCATSAEQLQNLLDCFSSSCDKFGLTISLKKTVTMSQATESHHFTINETTLDDVEKFTYLGSTLSKNTTLDQEIATRLGKASTTFGRLTKRVWKNRHLSIRTKVRVYEACVLSILLYGAESWATYRPQESKLSAFHTFNLRFILGKTWEDRMTNEEVFKITGSGPLSSRLKFFRLRWAGHVNRMPCDRIPRLLLHGVLEEGTRQTGRPRLRFKDVLKRDLKDFNIEPESWTTLSKERPSWRSSLHAGRLHDTKANLDKLQQKRLRRQ